MQPEKKVNDGRQPVILFADDDVTCLEVCIKMLQQLGYKVLDAKDGIEAIEAFKSNQSEVDLVILDMNMPHNGGSTFDQLKKIDENVRVIIASGYAESQRIREMMEQGCYGFIQKPFSLNVLSQKILNVLND